MSKRPLGLSKSKGKGSAALTSKKQKIAHEAEDSQSSEDDWEDLQELFARANATFIKGGKYYFRPSQLMLTRTTQISLQLFRSSVVWCTNATEYKEMPARKS
jgi:hypothetical protein